MTTKKFNVNKDNVPTWFTPPEIVGNLGSFDLDPCTDIRRPFDIAKTNYTVTEDGLSKDWFGRVWLNPPYGKELKIWLEKMSKHLNGIALIFNRSDTKAFQDFVFPYADSILFLKGRINFIDTKGVRAKSNGGAPSLLLGYSEYDSDILSQSGLSGYQVSLKPQVFVIGISTKETWKVIVGDVLKEYGRPVALKTIYSYVVSKAPERIRNNKHYRAKVRQVLQTYYKRKEKGVYSYE